MNLSIGRHPPYRPCAHASVDGTGSTRVACRYMAATAYGLGEGRRDERKIGGKWTQRSRKVERASHSDRAGTHSK